jgi:hypothetical protein
LRVEWDKQNAWIIWALLPLVICTLSATGANAYSCRIPKSLLCDGCANDLSITLLPNGSCRISFALPDHEHTKLPQSGTVNLEVSVAPRAAQRRVVPLTRTRIARGYPHIRYTTQTGPAQQGSCFVFNGSRYCE